MRALPAGIVRGVLLCGALVAVAGCQNKNPASPSPALSTAAGGITIAGNTALNQPGDTSQLTAAMISADGTTGDVTNVAVWSGGDGVVTVRGGLLTAVEYGRGLIKATAEGLVQSMPVRVLPEGMFLLQGHVTESGGPLAQTRVEVTSTSGTVSATTNGSGLFALPGAGPVSVRTEKTGYQAAVRQLTVEGDATVDIVLLREAGTPGNIRGWYTLTFTASPSCALPPEAMRRTYAALVDEGRLINRPEDLVVTLSGADFVGWANDDGFTGRLQGKTVRFDITDSFDADYAVIERIGKTMDLYYSGTATGTVSDRAIVTTFSGKLIVRSATGPGTLAECTASDHRLELVR
jgi:hypothetical protein